MARTLIRSDEVDGALLAAVRQGLAEVAEPAHAEPMRAYMKSTLPYWGVTIPAVRKVCRRVFAAHPLATYSGWEATTRSLWREAGHREEWYAAIELAGFRAYREFQTLDALALYDEMIVTGAWWDVVDAVATHQIGDLLRRYPDAMRRTALAWRADDDIWRRRAAIICQCGLKAATDQALLFACIEPNLSSREFFIRKAIGWALREHAHFAPEAVRAFVAAHEAEISPLSRREALKHLGGER